MHILQGHLAHKKRPPPEAPTADLCLRPYGGRGRGGVFFWGRYPCACYLPFYRDRIECRFSKPASVDFCECRLSERMECQWNVNWTVPDLSTGWASPTNSRHLRLQGCSNHRTQFDVVWFRKPRERSCTLCRGTSLTRKRSPDSPPAVGTSLGPCGGPTTERRGPVLYFKRCLRLHQVASILK